jgi:hypothetical protein
MFASGSETASTIGSIGLRFGDAAISWDNLCAESERAPTAASIFSRADDLLLQRWSRS